MKKLTRRDFISGAAAVAGGMILLPALTQCASTKAVPGKTGNYKIPEAESAVVYKEDSIIISRSGNIIYALSTVCTHYGCQVAFAEKDKKVACPCHGSVFDLTGKKLEGPAGRGLDRFVPEIAGTMVKVDFSKFFKESDTGYQDAAAIVK